MFSSNTSQVSSSAANYVEDVFSTYLYTGTGASQTITNNIDTTTYGGLVWVKGRSGATGHRFTDTARGTTKSLESNSTAAEVTESTGLTAFGTTGFTIGADADYNTNAATYASWTFRKQAKFFDVVTYTGNGSNRTIAHNLGSVPGCIIVKRTDTTANWQVYHRSLANTEYMVLNTTANKATGTTRWNSTTPTSTEFSLGTDATVNANGGTYVAYLFAHNAGGFGLTGSDNVISCGSFTTDASGNATVSLGYEPQWILRKRVDAADDWYLLDNMRGLVVDNGTGTGDKYLYPNASYAEFGAYGVDPTSTGFNTTGIGTSSTHIYIAIRRGPMKTPTSGTSVFTPVQQTSQSAVTTNFPVDAIWSTQPSNGGSRYSVDRLRGGTQYLYLNDTAVEGTIDPDYAFSLDNNTGFNPNLFYPASRTVIYWSMRRAPSFMDMVCYTGTGSVRTINHNLGVAPEMMIVKVRGANTGSWRVYHSALGPTKLATLNLTNAAATLSTIWNDTAPTASVFTVGTYGEVNLSGDNFVAYLFATCAGVSKVGSYTGTGTTLQIDCGFTGGARFVLIKRTDSTGDWYVWDTARGIVSGNDPYLILNDTAAQVTNTDYIDTYSAGFEISSTAPAAINANGGTFIFLAIA